MKVLIVDDERLARIELSRLLTPFKDFITEIREAENGIQALSILKSYPAELVFMDVQMPGLNGFDTLSGMDSPKPDVIFTTAFDEYALQAFEFSAIDYLLKPIDPERLTAALEKVKQQNQEENREDDITSVHIGIKKVLTENDQVFIKDGEKCYFIKLNQVRYFESIGNYVQLHLEGAKPMILRSLNALEDRLDSETFFRASRKNIVNLKKIENVEPYFSGGLLLKMEGGTKIEVSRRQAAKFKELLSL